MTSGGQQQRRTYCAPRDTRGQRADAGEDTTAALEYARGIHAEALESNNALYTRAQFVLTLDGLLLAAAGAALAAKPDDLQTTVTVFGGTTWAEFSIATAALIASVLSSALALSPIRRPPLRSEGEVEYNPKTMWYWSRVAELEPDRFIERAEHVDAAFEIQARLSQVTIMAPYMVRRATWVSRAYVCNALSLIFFGVAATDYLIRLNG